MKRFPAPSDIRPTVITALLWLSILPGQLLRLELKTGSAGILAPDIAALLVLAYAGFAYRREWGKWKRDGAVKLLAIWAGTLTLSCVFAFFHYGLHDGALAVAYLVRLLAYLSLFVVFSQLGATAKRPFLRYGTIAILALFFLGILILHILPDFAALAAYGWDPHVGRFTSTWLDPNYLGTFLALAAAGIISFEKKLWPNKLHWLLMALLFFICTAGIYSTISRSAVVTLAVAAGIAGIRTSWRSLLLAIVGVVLVVTIPSRLQNRLNDSVGFVATSATSHGATSSSSTSDPTASDRINSWKRAWELTKHSPLFGVGYNYYEPATIRYGLIESNGETRGTSGSDSSLLTLLATSGVVGLAAFLAWIGYIIVRLLKKKSAWTTASLSALAGLAVGSQLNNALLYPFLLLPLVMLLGIAYAETKES